jgi:hypothetical protein
MYVDVSHVCQGGKTYARYLLRESYREDGKVKHRTIANLSGCSAAEIEAVRLALRHKDNLSALGINPSEIVIKQGLSYGAVHVVYEVAHSLGIVAALGTTREGLLALWQVIARVIDQGSRLSAVRLARAHAAQEILGVGKFDEDDLYANLDWLAKQQPDIEKALFEKQQASQGLFLYDVTSTYLEGKHNAFGAFGYNRDGKRGKLQIVVGLLCDGAGRPLAIEVFPGNTQDTKTFASQVDKVAKRFGGGEITFVGDRGMIKGPQIKALQEDGFHFITAITKSQIQALLTQGVLQMSLFDAPLAEVTTSAGQRYILRRNPERAKEIAASRESKYRALNTAAVAANEYLATHPRAKPGTQLKNLGSRAAKLRVSGWTTFNLEARTITIGKDPEALAEASKLDGCYVLKTDLAQTAASKDIVHNRYKDLALVEWAFRESKTVHLEIRPVNVRLETRTRGHAFVVMLAYSIIRALATLWRDLDLTVQEGLDQLSTLCLNEILLPDRAVSYQLPTPREGVRQLLDAAAVRLPTKIVAQASRVATKAKLPNRRK